MSRFSEWSISGGARLSGKQEGRLIDLFVVGVTAWVAAEIAGVTRNTARAFYHRRRQLIASNLPSYDLLAGWRQMKVTLMVFARANAARSGVSKVRVFGC